MDIANSSTSSSKLLWRRFVITIALLLVVFTSGLYTFVVLIDPYDNLPISLDIDRTPVDVQQRFFHPALARKSIFDSAVIGNSNIRLFKPEQLNRVLGGAFVNLGMDAATPWEQQQIFNVFRTSHQQISTIIYGLDYLWCYEMFVGKRHVAGRTAAGFPEWMYDNKQLNNFPPLNNLVLRHSWKQMRVALGLDESRYGRDGYSLFTGPMSEYDLHKAREKIYGSIKPKSRKMPAQPYSMSREKRAQLNFESLTILQEMLAMLHENTRKIVLFVPYHYYFQSPEGSRTAIVWEECKRRTVHIAAQHENSYVLDFMIDSPITREDGNYWDHKHYNAQVATRLVNLVGGAVTNGAENPNYQLLYPDSDQ